MSTRKSKRVSRKTFCLRTYINGKDVPDFGLGEPGLIREAEYVFADNGNRGFNTGLFAMALVDEERKVADELLRFEWKEKRNARRTRVRRNSRVKRG